MSPGVNLAPGVNLETGVVLKDGVNLEEIDLTDLDRFVDGFPDAVFTLLRQEAPYGGIPPRRTPRIGIGFWVLSAHADIMAVAADAASFSSERSEGPRERRLV